MFELQTLLILNRFQCTAQLAQLMDGQEEKDTGKEDRAGSDEKEKDRREYVEARLRKIKEWERRLRGETTGKN